MVYAVPVFFFRSALRDAVSSARVLHVACILETPSLHHNLHYPYHRRHRVLYSYHHRHRRRNCKKTVCFLFCFDVDIFFQSTNGQRDNFGTTHGSSFACKMTDRLFVAWKKATRLKTSL